MAIEKNSVLGQPRKELYKSASSGCPICGSSLDMSGSLPRCPKHGTAPFEYGAHIASRGHRSSR